MLWLPVGVGGAGRGAVGGGTAGSRGGWWACPGWWRGWVGGWPCPSAHSSSEQGKAPEPRPWPRAPWAGPSGRLMSANPTQGGGGDWGPSGSQSASLQVPGQEPASVRGVTSSPQPPRLTRSLTLHQPPHPLNMHRGEGWEGPHPPRTGGPWGSARGPPVTWLFFS